MGVYQLLINWYNQFLGMFPDSLQWLVSLAILVGFVWLFFNLISGNALFLILLVVFLPVVIPILVQLLGDFYAFFLFLLHQVGLDKT